MYLLSLLATASAAVAQSYSISAYAPGTPLHDVVVHAAEYGFYGGIESPKTYCPLKPAWTCPLVVGTLVSPGMGSLKVMVPGGQAIYVRTDGKVGFSMAHSAYIPPGALQGAWVLKTMGNESESTDPVERGVMDFDDGRGHTGITFCPNASDPTDGTLARYGMYAKTEGFNLTGCIDAVGLKMRSSKYWVGCYQYA